MTPKTLSFSAPSSCMGSIGLFFLWTVGLSVAHPTHRTSGSVQRGLDASRASEQRLGSGSECCRDTTKKVTNSKVNPRKRTGCGLQWPQAPQKKRTEAVSWAGISNLCHGPVCQPRGLCPNTQVAGQLGMIQSYHPHNKTLKPVTPRVK